MADPRHRTSSRGVATPTRRVALLERGSRAGIGTTRVRGADDAGSGVMARHDDLGVAVLDVRLGAEHHPHGDR